MNGDDRSGGKDAERRVENGGRARPLHRSWIAKRAAWLGWAPAVALAVLGIFAGWWLMEPACPKKIVLATGSPTGAYFAFGQQYRQILAEQGIELEIRETAGSVENLKLLGDDNSGVSIALVQSGTAPRPAEDDDSKRPRHSDEQLESLASLYLEPVWIFYRDGEPRWNRLSRLAGKRVAIGAPGSGTRAIAETLLSENEIREGDPDGTQLFPLGGEKAADALIAGDVDVAILVIAGRSEIISRLLTSEGIHLLSLRRAAAYCHKFPYLSQVTLAEGLLDLRKNIPDRDISLVAPTACLVARGDLHHALVPLLLEAATEIHRGGNFFEEPGAFPSPNRVEMPLAGEARRFFARGPSMLYRYLPFRVAAWIDRVKLMILPLMTLLLPLAKVAPPAYRWRIRSKIFRWYRVLREIDQKMKDADGPVDFSEDVARLRRLEPELASVSVPLSYMEEFYNLRLHIAHVLARLEERQSQRRPLRKAS